MYTCGVATVATNNHAGAAAVQFSNSRVCSFINFEIDRSIDRSFVRDDLTLLFVQAVICGTSDNFFTGLGNQRF